MTSRRFACVLLVAIVFLSPFSGVEACGPDFEPDVFVKIESPDNLRDFLQGKLGILQRGYDSDEYAVAHRYLNGGKLSEQERATIDPPHGPTQVQDWTKLTPDQIEAARDAERQARTAAQPTGAWLKARAEYLPEIAKADQEQSFPKDYAGDIVFDPNYLNCPDPAFHNAILTLNKRANLWGRKSPWLADWIHGQDAVFSNCAGKSLTAPASAPADSPALLHADRNYQLASAIFYTKQFDQAAQQFTAIAHDKNSPWNSWGEYLAARALVRKSFALGKVTDPYSGDLASFDLVTMQSAQKRLEAVLAEHNPEPSREIIADELNFIRLRTEPEKRLAEICAALEGPASDDNFGHDLQDLSFILMKHIAIANPPPLYAWIAALRGTGTADTAFATWQQGRSLPWLVLALVKASPSDRIVPQVLAETEKIKPGSPAFDTVFYHRIRLLIERDQADEARSLLDRTLPTLRSQPASSNQNALLSERLAVARNFKEFLDFAPRKIVVSSSFNEITIQGNCAYESGWDPKPDYCPTKDSSPPLNHTFEFDEDSVYVLNRQTPIDLLVEAASSPSLPLNLRRDIVLATWTRSVLLEDKTSASKLVSLLPKSIRDSTGTSIEFPATLAILRNPGLRPYLAPGFSRLASFNVLDDYRDNWWGDWWEGKQVVDAEQANPLPFAKFFDKEQRASADAQYEHLRRLPSAAALLGQRALDYAKAHPADPDVPEALALTVRATRYPSEDWQDQAKSVAEIRVVSKAAFQMLHARYPKSPWTVKTRYYY